LQLLSQQTSDATAAGPIEESNKKLQPKPAAVEIVALSVTLKWKKLLNGLMLMSSLLNPAPLVSKAGG
jgi:hypothetical protein